MTDKSNPGPPPSPTTPTAGKLLRRSNSDRLRMHAPSSIKIAAPTAGRVLEWKTAIPLLSPLDPTVEIGRWEEDEGGEGNVVVAGGTTELRWSTWQHPAAPFSYEPVPPDPAGLLLPHCA